MQSTNLAKLEGKAPSPKVVAFHAQLGVLVLKSRSIAHRDYSSSNGVYGGMGVWSTHH